MLAQRGINDELQHLFAEAGCDGFLCARDLERNETVALKADELVISASVFKVLVALTFFTLAELGELDPTERVRVDPRTSLGAPAGLSIFEDEVEASFRDLVNSMLSVSDMIATDTVIDRIGIHRINLLAQELTLTETVVPMNLVTTFHHFARDVGFESWQELASHAWRGEEDIEAALERMRQAAVCDPSNPQATRTTARETTELLRMIWRDMAGPPRACERVRFLMGKQLQGERIARAFRNDPDVRFAGKTGTFGGRYRNEAGVFEFPDGGRYAVSVFTRGHELYTRPLDIDDAIGEAARVAVTELRARRG
jgi:beta-lactamase class A